MIGIEKAKNRNLRYFCSRRRKRWPGKLQRFYKNSFTESQNSLCWKTPLETIQSNPTAKTEQGHRESLWGLKAYSELKYLSSTGLVKHE